MKPLTHHVPLRSNMEGVLRHAANRGRKEIFTRNDVIRRVRREHERADIIAEAREKQFPTRLHKRIANIRVNHAVNGFHVTGIGNIAEITRGELNHKLRVRGFTGARHGAILQTV